MDCFHLYYALPFACRECWSLLATRKTPKPGKYRFQKSQALAKPGAFLMTAPFMYNLVHSFIGAFFNHEKNCFSPYYLTASPNRIVRILQRLCSKTNRCCVLYIYIYFKPFSTNNVVNSSLI